MIYKGAPTSLGQNSCNFITEYDSLSGGFVEANLTKPEQVV